MTFVDESASFFDRLSTIQGAVRNCHAFSRLSLLHSPKNSNLLMDLLVGTFNTPVLYTLRFTPPGKLELIHRNPAIGSHSWLALSPSKNHLYATAWLAKPSVVAYTVRPDHGVQVFNEKYVKGRSGYVTASETHLYSAGGVSGEVFTIEPDGAIGSLVQELDFEDVSTQSTSDNSGDSHGGFGGLRNGAHSVDLSPDRRALYVADIGRNCVWTFEVQHEASTNGQHLQDQHKHVSPRPNDGPRHTTPHPNGQVLYSVQEHSAMVDAFRLDGKGTRLEHVQGVRIMPEDKRESDYWADEVRVSDSGDGMPRFLYASTRGLRDETKGFVSVFHLHQDGMIDGQAIHIWETPTSGGIANAVEPAPMRAVAALVGEGQEEYMALTDSLEGWVFVLSFDGRRLQEAARLKLGEGVQAATAVWL